MRRAWKEWVIQWSFLQLSATIKHHCVFILLSRSLCGINAPSQPHNHVIIRGSRIEMRIYSSFYRRLKMRLLPALSFCPRVLLECVCGRETAGVACTHALCSNACTCFCICGFLPGTWGVLRLGYQSEMCLQRVSAVITWLSYATSFVRCSHGHGLDTSPTHTHSHTCTLTHTESCVCCAVRGHARNLIIRCLRVLN